MTARTRKPEPTAVVAVGYVRVSTAEQATTGWSLDAQRRRVEAYCEAKGWPVAAIYADEGVSAVKHRPAWEQLLTDVLADGVTHVVGLKLDRFGRSAKQLLDMYEAFEAKGVALVCIEDNIDTSTPVGRLMRTVLAAVAEFERDLISERTKNGLAEARIHLAKQGKRLGRPAAVPDEVVARIRSEHAAGVSLGAIARALSDEGVPTAHGGARWYPSTVRAVLARQ